MNNDTQDERQNSNQAVDDFLNYHYTQVKDLCQAFIGILSGILIFSVNFAEKLGDMKNSSSYHRFIVLGSWSCFLLSIIICSLALAFTWIAARRMLWDRADDKIRRRALSLSRRAADLLVLAGFIFVIGLFLVIVAGFIGFGVRLASAG